MRNSTEMLQVPVDRLVEYRPIPSAPGYEAGSDGTIRSIDRLIVKHYARGPAASLLRGRVLRPWIAGGRVRYLYVCLGVSRRSSVHRLICEAFHGLGLDGMYVAHLDDNPTNNDPENLAWATPSENARQCVSRGRHRRLRNTWREGQKKRGPKPRRSPMADQIEALRSGGQTLSEIARAVGMSKSGVHGILSAGRVS